MLFAPFYRNSVEIQRFYKHFVSDIPLELASESGKVNGI